MKFCRCAIFKLKSDDVDDDNEYNDQTTRSTTSNRSCHTSVGVSDIPVSSCGSVYSYSVVKIVTISWANDTLGPIAEILPFLEADRDEHTPLTALSCNNDLRTDQLVSVKFTNRDRADLPQQNTNTLTN